MTRRTASHANRWLNAGVVLTGVIASLVGASLLQWQADAAVPAAPSSLPVAANNTVVRLPASMDGQDNGPNADAVVVELEPVPTVVAPSDIPVPRPVARSRSSR